jgi:PPE-repeat protein
MVFDFGALPPEINSARMYAGPGAGPLLAAAAAWNNLAAEMSTTASGSQSVISELTGEEWLGPSSAAMATAAAPYVEWMHTTAEQLQLAATQATASAAAYEAAFAMTVPPPVIAANRAQLAALVATNILGQNTPAIAATEAQYGEMWTQNAAAMYNYAGSSASAGKLDPLTSPTPATNPGGPAAQAAAVSQAAGTQAGLPGLVSNTPSAVQSLAAPAAASSSTPSLSTIENALTGGPLNDLFDNSLLENTFNGITDDASWNGFNAIVTGILYGHTAATSGAGASAAGGLGAGLGGGVLAGTAAPTSAAAAAGFGGAPALASMGQASSVGELSVPTGWSAAAPAEPGSVLAGSGWTAPAEEGGGMTTVPAGMPALASASRGAAGFGAPPRYGFKPTVMPRTVLV